MLSSKIPPQIQQCQRKNALSRRLVIDFDNYKKISYGSNQYKGITDIELKINEDIHERDMKRMVYDVCTCNKFDNLYNFHLNAPNCPIDGEVLDLIAKKKYYIRGFFLTVFVVYTQPKEMWKHFDSLSSFYMNISDGYMVPNCTDNVVSGIRVSENIILENCSPFKPPLNIDMLMAGSEAHRKNIHVKGYTTERRDDVTYEDCLHPQ